MYFFADDDILSRYRMQTVYFLTGVNLMRLSPSLKTVIADISLVFVALFWGIGFVAMKDALDTFPTFWLLTLRFGSAALLMGILFRRRLAAITK
ncbi:MAG: hypothetical protein GX635_08280, partial [Synergistaceae bacterium]|nr:hypothetical protein [Synergistaceae bacterium]